ncbi:MAG TPA: hypothetical protein VGY54_12070 [Polyangiaceae bacterium]|nr:hypothetical protein [Polyangiaceae bacterium]
MTARRLVHRVGEAWPQLRAALLSAHCLAIALAAIPLMSRTHAIAVSDPQFASEVHPWAELLGVSDEMFASRAERLRADWIEVRDCLIGPFERYLTLLGAQQPWGMFSSPNRSPSRFVLEVWDPRDAPTEDVVSQDDWRFLSGLPPGAWRPSFFESERTRTVVNKIARNDLWSLADQFCLYVAREAFQDNRTWEQARCTFVSEPASPPPWRARAVAVPTPGPHVDYRRVVKRDQ